MGFREPGKGEGRGNESGVRVPRLRRECKQVCMGLTSRTRWFLLAHWSSIRSVISTCVCV